MIEKFLSSQRLHWLWRIGWLERLVFLTIRFFTFRFARPSSYVLQLDLFGFDFSKWQGVIEFIKVLLYGTKFLILRAAYGLTRDERFVEYMQTAAELFLGRLSVYHYYVPTVDPFAQANKLIEIIEPYRKYIRRVWGDFEFPNTGAYEKPTHWQKYAETIVNAGYKFGVYTRATWWDSRVGTLASWFGQFPGWFAQYAPWLTLIPKGWTKAAQWQMGTPVIGTEVGTTSKEVDYNICDDEFFVKEYDGVIPEPPPTGEPMDHYYKVTPSIAGEWRSIRREAIPHISGSKFTQINAGSFAKCRVDDVYVYAEGMANANKGDRWLHVFEANGAPVDGWTAEIHLGKRYLNVQEIGAPIDPPPTQELPVTWDVTQVAKNDTGEIIATYKGTLSKQ